MPSLRDVADDGWYIFYITQLEIPSIGSQLDRSCQGNRYGTEKAGSTALWYGPCITYKITPAGLRILPVILFQPARRAAVLG
jgi:hypothetical protein